MSVGQAVMIKNSFSYSGSSVSQSSDSGLMSENVNICYFCAWKHLEVMNFDRSICRKSCWVCPCWMKCSLYFQVSWSKAPVWLGMIWIRTVQVEMLDMLMWVEVRRHLTSLIEIIWCTQQAMTEHRVKICKTSHIFSVQVRRVWVSPLLWTRCSTPNLRGSPPSTTSQESLSNPTLTNSRRATCASSSLSSTPWASETRSTKKTGTATHLGEWEVGSLIVCLFES